jgi:cbb3-type cytochrome oxidase subunit 3
MKIVVLSCLLVILLYLVIMSILRKDSKRSFNNDGQGNNDGN